MLHLRLRLLPLLRAATQPTTTTTTTPALFSSLHRLLLSSSTSTATPFSVEDYLVATCGLTAAQSLKASKKLSTLRSPSNPDAMLALLSGAGLSRPDIAAVVAADPLILTSRADNIARRLASLRDRVGLSAPQIARFVLAGGGGRALRSCDVAPKLEFWIPFLGSSFESLLRVLRSNHSILVSDLDKVVKPNIALLRERGLSVCDIAKLALHTARLFASKPETVEAFVARADALGMPRASKLFWRMVSTMSRVGEDKVAARMEFLSRILGCSIGKVRAAVCKMPYIVGYCEEKLQVKIEFFVGVVGLEPEYILERPALLGYSLEKRLRPRHYVVKALMAKGLVKKDAGFYNLFACSDKGFRERYIDDHKHAVPGLADAYAAVCAGKVPANN